MTSPPDRSPDRRRLPVLIAAVVLLLGACGGSGGTDDARPAATTASASGAVSPEEFAAFIAENPEVPLVNVHIPYEGHIEGTDSFVAFDEIADWDGLPSDKAAPLAIYCRSGNMSATAVETLSALGYRNIVELDGGMNAWSSADYGLLNEKPPPS